ncbi:MAG: thiamine-phosphate kinase [Flavobacteriales bacterium]|nr:thiamine-phosphate kinase [Flavobacteriales bacterium]
MDKNLNAISSIGEFGLIDKLTKDITINHKSTSTGIGDDAAVINKGKLETVLTTDMLIEGVHFDMVFTPLKHLGYKAVAVNVSDICAMNATPTQLLVSIGMSSKYSLEAIEEIYDGIKHAAKIYKLDIIGGDITTNPAGLAISITAIGEAEKKDIVFRSGAKENDLIVVSGDLGGAYMGLNILKREKEVWASNPSIQPDLSGNDYILERQLKPEARIDVIKLLNELKIKPTSMIDISDGLASELIHLCKQSKKGCQLFEDKIPIDPTTHKTALEFNINPTTCALNGGEDYELLFTVDLKDYDKIKTNPNFSVIGHINNAESGTNLITNGGNSTPLTAQGWDHFS